MFVCWLFVCLVHSCCGALFYPACRCCFIILTFFVVVRTVFLSSDFVVKFVGNLKMSCLLCVCVCVCSSVYVRFGNFGHFPISRQRHGASSGTAKRLERLIRLLSMLFLFYLLGPRSNCCALVSVSFVCLFCCFCLFVCYRGIPGLRASVNGIAGYCHNEGYAGMSEQ